MLLAKEKFVPLHRKLLLMVSSITFILALVSALISYVVETQKLLKSDTVYIGDTQADYTATKANQLHYIMAMWGYDSDEFSHADCVCSPKDILTVIDSI